MLDLIVAAVGVVLLVAGVALLSVPAALITAGVVLLAIAMTFDLPPRGRGTE